MDRRALLLGLLFAPFAAVAKPEGLAKPLVIGRVYNLPGDTGRIIGPLVYSYDSGKITYIGEEVIFG